MEIDYRDEQFLLDINWYFADQYNRLIVVASGGGTLPEFLFENNNQNDIFHEIVYELPERFESQRNEQILEVIPGLEKEDMERYFRDFDSLAKKGFYAYDKINLDEPEDSMYLLVAYPIYDTNKDSLPIDPKFLETIPKISQAIISRTNSSFKSSNFNPINLLSILNNQ